MRLPRLTSWTKSICNEIESMQRIGIATALRGNLALLSLMCLLVTFLVALNIAKPVLFSKFVDEGLGGQDWNIIQRLILVLLMVSTGIVCISYCHQVIAAVIANRLAFQIKASLVEKIFQLRYDALQKIKTGDIVTRTDSDVDHIQDYVMSVLHTTMNNMLNLVAAIVYVSIVQWTMLIPSLVMIPLLSAAMYCFRGPLYRASQNERKTQAESNSKLTSYIDNMLHIRNLNLDARSLGDTEDALSRLKNSRVRNECWDGAYDEVDSLVLLIGYVLTLGYGSWLVVDGELSIGSLFAFLTLRRRFIAPLNFIHQVSTRYFATKPSILRLIDLYNAPSEEGIVGRALVPGHTAFTSLKAEGVKFSYNRQLEVLKEINIEFPRGWSVVYGKNGAGKSTLAKLVSKFVVPSGGRISTDDEDIGRFDNRDWRRFVTTISPGSYLLDDTIRENVRLYDKSITDHDIVDALDMVGLLPDLACRPGFLDAKLSGTETGLSSGEIQKLAIARVVLKDTPIYLFDEPLAHVTEKDRSLIMKHLKARLADKIVICISHDNIDEYVDYSYRLDGGLLKRIDCGHAQKPVNRPRSCVTSTVSE